MPTVLKDMQIFEVSAVDRGAGEGVKVLLMKRAAESGYTSLMKGDLSDEVWAYLKREFSDDKRKELAGKGHALPDGSYPIENKGDLKNAIQAIGRAKNPAKAKAHIKRRASALGASDLIPESWGKRDEGDDVMDKKTEDFIAGLVAKHDKKLAKKAKRQEIEKAMLPSEQAFYKTLGKNDAKSFRKMTAEQRAAVIKAGKMPQKKPAPQDDDQDEDDVGKRLESAAADVLAKAHKEADDLRKRLGTLENERAVDLAKADCREMGIAESEAATMVKARAGDKDAIAKLEEVCKTLKKQRDEAARTGAIFSEIGKAGGGQPQTAYDKLQALAADVRKADPKLTPAQAFDKVVSDPANSALVKQEREEHLAKIQKLAA